ncbi:MAG: shikimate kinase [Planctomycetota bacterium]
MQTIALMGLRGSGKSTVGPAVAAGLGMPFRDLDPLVLAWNRLDTVREVVDAQGWPAFRALELGALDRVLKESACVLALGGGTPTHTPSRELLEIYQSSASLRIIYLRAQPDTLASRLTPSDDRPSLTGMDAVQEVADVFQERDPLYAKLADSIVECDGLSIDDQVEAVLSVAKP